MDFKIEVVARDVTRGDLEDVLAYLDERGPDFDAARGDWTVRVSQRENESRQWFTSDEDDPQ